MNTESTNKQMNWQTVELDPVLLAKVRSRMAFGRFGDFGEADPTRKKKSKAKIDVSEPSYQPSAAISGYPSESKRE